MASLEALFLKLEAVGCCEVSEASPITQWYEQDDCKLKIDNLAFSKFINQLIGKLTDYPVSSFIKS
jgi:hypothetical protein